MSDRRYEAWQRFCAESDRQVADFNAKPQKRCPFCGGESYMYWNYGDHEEHFVIECKSCEARVKSYCFDEAVRQWNRRTESGESPKYLFEYCVQFRRKRTDDEWRVINWSVGPLKRAREALKSMVIDSCYRQYEYRIGVRRLTGWGIR